jgi:hypothetical protein
MRHADTLIVTGLGLAIATIVVTVILFATDNIRSYKYTIRASTVYKCNEYELAPELLSLRDCNWGDADIYYPANIIIEEE